MMIAKTRPNAASEKENSYIWLIFWSAVFFLLLLARDTFSIGINKNIFILITCFCAVTMKIPQLVYLFCFLFPLYVGLPGNYMTLILLARILMNKNSFKAPTFIASLLVCTFIAAQNLIKGTVGIVQMIYIAGILLVMMLFAVKDQLDPKLLIILYSAGVAALGFIMLTATLKVYNLSDLMSNSFRLGTTNVNYVDQGVMNVSVDPNFYGMFSIAAISLAIPLTLKSRVKPIIKFSLIGFVIVQIMICLVGLSRAFILVFIAWLFLYLLSQRSFKGLFIATVSMIAVVVLIVTLMPEVLNTLLARFNDSDMASGNGRIRLINEFLGLWSENILTVLFGVGFFSCNVHCTPLQFLFGGGLVLFVLMIVLVASYRDRKPTKMTLAKALPGIVTFVMMCTVPAAGLLNFMYPLVIIGLTSRNDNTSLNNQGVSDGQNQTINR